MITKYILVCRDENELAPNVTWAFFYRHYQKYRHSLANLHEILINYLHKPSLGRSLISEFIEFTEEALRIAKDLLINIKNEINVRVGALYLLYGLYCRQPIRAGSKIRVTEDEYRVYLGLMHQLRVWKHLDALFISCKLIVMRAFIFVATVHPYGLHKSFRKYHDTSLDIIDMEDSTMDRQLESIALKSGLFPALSSCNDLYYKFKCVLPGAGNLEPEVGLNSVNTKLSCNLKENYENLLLSYKYQFSVSDDGASTSVGIVKKQDNRKLEKNQNTIRDRRREIKKKAFQTNISKDKQVAEVPSQLKIALNKKGKKSKSSKVKKSLKTASIS